MSKPNGTSDSAYAEPEYDDRSTDLLDGVSPQEVLDAITTVAAEQVRMRPYLSMGVGAGVGFLLASGLPPSLVRVAGEFALRSALAAQALDAAE